MAELAITPDPVSAVETGPPKLSRPLWILREIAAICIWVLAPIKAFVYDFDERFVGLVAPSMQWILNFKFFILGGLLILSMGIFSKRLVRWTAWFVVCYPFIILWRITKFSYRNPLTALIFLPAVVDFVRRIKFTFVTCFFAGLAMVLVMAEVNAVTTICAIAYLFFFLFKNLWRQIAIAYGGENIYGLLKKEIKANWKPSASVSAAVEKEQDPKKKEEIELNGLNGLLLSDFLSAAFVARLREFKSSRRLEVHLALSILYSCILTGVTFAFAYYGLQRVTPSSFGGWQKPDFFSALYFSCITLIRYGSSAIVPTSAIAQTLFVTEAALGYLLGFLLIVLIFTTRRKKIQEDLEGLITALLEIGATIESELNERHHLTIIEARARFEPIPASLRKLGFNPK